MLSLKERISMAKAIKNIHSKEVTQAICDISQFFEPSIVKQVRGGIYFYTSHWMDTDITLRESGVIKYRKLKKQIKLNRLKRKQTNG